MLNLFKHELFSRWVTILGWGIGLAAFASMYISVFPSMAEQMEGLAQIDLYRAMGIDLGSFAGYIASVVVQIVPVILGVFVINVSTDTLAGEEENGTLELVVAMPLPRWQIVAMKALALAVVIFLILAILGAGSAFTLTIIKQTTEVDVTPMQLFVALFGTFPLMLAFFSIGLFFGTILPTRRLAIATMTIIYTGSFLAKSIAGYVLSMEYLNAFSLFSYVDTTTAVFSEGLDVNNILILLTISAIFLGLAVWGFQGRNITVGQWVWERNQAPTH